MRLGARLLVLGLAGCTQPPPVTIDGSSAETFARTTEAARDDLPIADRLEFDRAIATIASRHYSNRDTAVAARVAFAGMTAAEVVATERERISGRM